MTSRMGRPRVAYQGAPAAFGEEAVQRYWGGRAQPVPAASFVAVVAAVRDGDAAFAFQFIAVHDQVTGLLVITEHLCGMKNFVYKGGLSMVNVCDDRYISDVHIR